MSRSEVQSQYGLEDDWTSIQETLVEIIPVYDKTNRYISLGTDLKLRRRGIELLLSNFKDRDFVLLDLGCGTGTMTRLLRERVSQNQTEVVLVDPMLSMMRVARAKTHEIGPLAVYEHLPFRQESVDAAMAGFSLRDARNLEEALTQINGLLKKDGKFLIVDLSKPDSPLKIWLITVYWRVLAPVLAFASSGRLGLKFGALSTTFKRLPTISQFFALAVSQGFTIVNAKFSLMGGASVILLSKKSNAEITSSVS